MPGLDAAGRQRAADYMAHSRAVYHGDVVDFLCVPKLYTPDEVDRLAAIARTTHEILCAVTSAYVADASYRALFGFPPELEALILQDPGYGSDIPMLRTDIFYDEVTGDFQFCEFNTDGSSAMIEDREVSCAVSLTDAYARFAADHSLQRFETFDSWVDTLLRLYGTVAGAVARPRLAIGDFLDLTTPYEIADFAERFRAAGADAVVCDLRDLYWDGTRLRDPDGQALDVIYRRAVTSDIMARADEVTDFLAAVQAGAVTPVGSFRSQVAHSKTIFPLLLHDQTLRLLPTEQQEFLRRHVPRTELLSADDSALLDAVIREPARWIIKPADRYGAQDVVAGKSCDPDAWEQLVCERAAAGGHIVQSYIEQYRSPNLHSGYRMSEGRDALPLLSPGEPPQIRDYQELLGLYTYDGRFAGCLMRAGLSSTINAAAGGCTLGTFRVQ
ncbi:MAG: hypothetical protein LBS17_06840 [Actinomycetes bacterium]|nr:hypothetical protein [Actinomycetes bacterium]